MIRNTKINRHICLYISIVVLLSSWTVYYTLPYANLFYLVTVFAIVLSSGFTADRSQYLFAALFAPVIIRYFIPTDIPLSDKQFYYSFISMLAIFSIILLSTPKKALVYNYLSRMLSVIIGIGLVFHIFHMINYPISDYFTIYTSPSSLRSYTVYFTHSNPIIYGSEQIYRFSSIFNEPGYLGTILAFFLAIEKYNLKSFKNKILFIGGLLSLSGAFYFLTAIYFLFFVFDINRLKKWAMTIALATVSIIILFFFFPESFYTLIERFSFQPGEGFRDNRANISRFIQYVNYLKELDHGVLFWGEGRRATPEDYRIFIGHSSWVQLLVRLGVLFFTYMVFVLFYIAYKSKSKYTVMFVILFLLSINHRPVIFNLIYMFLLSYGLFYIDMQPDNYRQYKGQPQKKSATKYQLSY